MMSQMIEAIASNRFSKDQHEFYDNQVRKLLSHKLWMDSFEIYSSHGGPYLLLCLITDKVSSHLYIKRSNLESVVLHHRNLFTLNKNLHAWEYKISLNEEIPNFFDEVFHINVVKKINAIGGDDLLLYHGSSGNITDEPEDDRDLRLLRQDRRDAYVEHLNKRRMNSSISNMQKTTQIDVSRKQASNNVEVNSAQVVSISPNANNTYLRPSQITLHQKSRLLEIALNRDDSCMLPYALVRAYAPSAEVFGNQLKLELSDSAKEIGIIEIVPIDDTTLQITFDDGFISKYYTWGLLYRLCKNKDKLWNEYLQRSLSSLPSTKVWRFFHDTKLLKNTRTGAEYPPNNYTRIEAEIKGFELIHGDPPWVNDWDIEFIDTQSM